MTTWTSDQLGMIGAAEEAQVAPLRSDGTPGNPVTIWVVPVGDDLYVRSYRERDGAWYRAAQATHQGHIRAGGVEADVTFADETGAGINDQIDAAYRAKYRRYSGSFLDPMVTSQARSTTLKLVPR